jgi:hypothetical protein
MLCLTLLLLSAQDLPPSGVVASLCDAARRATSLGPREPCYALLLLRSPGSLDLALENGWTGLPNLLRSTNRPGIHLTQWKERKQRLRNSEGVQKYLGCVESGRFWRALQPLERRAYSTNPGTLIRLTRGMNSGRQPHDLISSTFVAQLLMSLKCAVSRSLKNAFPRDLLRLVPQHCLWTATSSLSKNSSTLVA